MWRLTHIALKCLALLLLGTAALACERDSPAASTDAASGSASGTGTAVPATLAPAALRREVAYDCGTLGQRATPACAPPPTWLGELERQGVYVTDPGMSRISSARCRVTSTALTAGLAHPVAELNHDARVLAQNAALRVFISSPKRCANVGVPDIAPAAAKLIRHLALTPGELDALGSHRKSEVETWLGAANAWQDMRPPRATRRKTLLHDEAEKHTRAFRPVRAGTTRGIFSQLIAIDTAWVPRVTSIVGKVELRRGLEDDAPACAATLDVEHILCGAQLQRVDELESLPTNRFFFRVADGQVGCNQCHSRARNKGANLVVAATSAPHQLRQAAVLEVIRLHIDGVRDALR